jgi:hypothetical protein
MLKTLSVVDEQPDFSRDQQASEEVINFFGGILSAPSEISLTVLALPSLHSVDQERPEEVKSKN